MTTTRTKELRLRIKASEPDAQQMAVIGAYTLREFKPEELMVREYLLAHSGIDRDNECFAPALLDAFAVTLPGKGVFVIHPTSWQGSPGPGEGKVFSARTERVSQSEARLQLREPDLKFAPGATDAVLLRVWAYYVRTPENEGFLLKLDAGIGTDVSVGFRATGPERLKDAEGRELNVWRWSAPGEAAEMSHVWLGAQPGARATKSARTENDVDLEEAKRRITSLEGERDTHKTAADTHKAAADTNAKAATSLAALKTALGETHAALLDNPAELAARVSDGASHRKSLIDGLIVSDRHAKLIGDDDAAVKSAQAEYDAMPTAALQRLAKRYEGSGSAAPQTGAIKGSEAGGGAPGAPSTGNDTKDAGPFGALS